MQKGRSMLMNKQSMKYNIIKIWGIIIIVLSIYVLYVTFGILLNSSLNITYSAVSVSDVEYIYKMSMFFIGYVFLVIFTVIIFLRAYKKNIHPSHITRDEK